MNVHLDVNDVLAVLYVSVQTQSDIPTHSGIGFCFLIRTHYFIPHPLTALETTRLLVEVVGIILGIDIRMMILPGITLLYTPHPPTTHVRKLSMYIGT